jgi:hypothetical protein
MDVLRPAATLTMVVMAAPFKDSSGMCGTSKHPFAHVLHCLAMDLWCHVAILLAAPSGDC